MLNLGNDNMKGETLFFPFNASGADGASITLATNGTGKVYKNGGTSEITTGVTLVEDHDGVAGRHGVQVVTTDAAYTPGDRFQVACDANTIDGKTVNAWVGVFGLQVRDSMRQVVGLAQGGAVGYVDLPTTASATDGAYDGALVTITSGTGVGQSRYRGATYTGSSRRFTVDPNWTVAPDSTSVVEVLVTAPAPTTTPMPVQVTSMAADVVTATAIAGGAITSAKIATDAIGSDQLAASAVTEIQTGLATPTTVRNALLNWELWSGFSLARFFRVTGTLWRGVSDGQDTITPSFTSPEGSIKITATLDNKTKANRLAVSDNASGTP
jgi:hypothetical protein